MLYKAQNKLNSHLNHRSFSNDDEIYIYLMSHVATVFCFLVHIFLLIYFSLIDMWPLIYMNVASILIYMVCFRLILRHKHITAGLIISLEVALYATVCSVLTGIGTYAIGYYLLVIIMQVTVPYGNRRMRVMILAYVFLCATAAILFDHYMAPPFAPAAHNFKQMMTMNIYIMLAGTLIELGVGTVVRRVISGLNEARVGELSKQVNTDPLTGLYNRRYADRYLLDLAASKPEDQTCVAMLDIDDFKQVNDTYGHAVGDEVLIFLADFMRRNLRKSDVIVRWGGEEFLIILREVSLAAAHSTLDKMRARLAATSILTHRKALNLTVTIGIARLDLANTKRSIEESDACLYRGKTSGKNKVVSKESSL